MSARITASRVRDTRKPITSRSAVNQAVKTRETLATAQAILRLSGFPLTADTIDVQIRQLNHAIAVYYRERG